MTTAATLSHPHLAGLYADLAAVRAEAERLSELSSAQRTWHPEPGVWSMDDCFEHLRRIDKAYCLKLSEAIPSAKSGATPYKPSWFARKFIGAVSPEATRKVKTMKGVNPQATPREAPSSNETNAVQRFLDQQAQLVELLQMADGKNINTAKFSSPLFALVRFTIGEALTMLVRHEQRHLAQAQRLTERADFPST